MNLNEDVGLAEADVHKVEHELDFVSQQQSEMEQIITQLEASIGEDLAVLDSGSTGIPLSHSDLQREEMYGLCNARSLVTTGR